MQICCNSSRYCFTYFTLQSMHFTHNTSWCLVNWLFSQMIKSLVLHAREGVQMQCRNPATLHPPNLIMSIWCCVCEIILGCSVIAALSGVFIVETYISVLIKM